jgi:hypothetical protein
MSRIVIVVSLEVCEYNIMDFEMFFPTCLVLNAMEIGNKPKFNI